MRIDRPDPLRRPKLVRPTGKTGDKRDRRGDEPYEGSDDFEPVETTQVRHAIENVIGEHGDAKAVRRTADFDRSGRGALISVRLGQTGQKRSVKKAQPGRKDKPPMPMDDDDTTVD